jgi:phosphate starvation-inducible protein PhoH
VSKKSHTKERPIKKTTTRTAVVSLSGDNTPYVFQRDKIDYEIKPRELKWTEKQQAIIELITHKDTKVVFLNGPAGCSKSLLAVFCALKLLGAKRVSEIIYVRSIVESATRSLGSLPGEAEDKFKPFAAPMVDKMEELLKESDIKRLFIDDRIKPIPVNYLRGASYNVNFVIADEMQNAVFSEIQTIMTRIGQFSKFVFCGDPAQSDLPPGKSGFQEIYNTFNNEEAKSRGIYCVELTEEDIMRSEICKFIVKTFKDLREKQNAAALSHAAAHKKPLITACTSTIPSWSPQRDSTIQ